jgi:hypothetical protein
MADGFLSSDALWTGRPTLRQYITMVSQRCASGVASCQRGRLSVAKNIGEEFVKDEYLCLHETVQNFDTKLIAIKAWSVTVGTAGIGSGFLQNKPSLFLLSALSSILFWIMDMMWRRYQVIYNYRILEIEKFIRRANARILPLQVSTSFSRYNSKNPRLWRKVALSFHVMLPHVAIVIVGTLLWLSEYLFP